MPTSIVKIIEIILRFFERGRIKNETKERQKRDDAVRDNPAKAAKDHFK